MNALVESLRYIVPNYSRETFNQYALTHGRINDKLFQDYLNTFSNTCLEYLGINRFVYGEKYHYLSMVLELLNNFDIEVQDAYDIAAHYFQIGLKEFIQLLEEIAANAVNNGDKLILKEIFGTLDFENYSIEKFIMTLQSRIESEVKMSELPISVKHKKLVNN